MKLGSKMEFDLEYDFSNAKLIGQGSFGSVYRCYSRYDNKEWAIKIIEVPNHPEYKQQAENEINIYKEIG